MSYACYKALIQAVQAGSRILDVASSAGRPAVPLAKVLPHVQFISTDLAPSSVHLALQHAKAAALANFTAQTADAQDLQDFSEATISAVTCSYGLQLMPDFPKALQEAYRVLQHGGLYVATLWGELEQCQMNQVCSVGMMLQLRTCFCSQCA